MAESKWLSIPEVARRLGISTSAVYDLIDSGALVARRTVAADEIDAADVNRLVVVQAESRHVFGEAVGGIVFLKRDAVRRLWTCDECEQPVLDVDRPFHARNHQRSRPPA
ncbi:MAG: helix-turn-helix domain-containing protein [Acidobacteria bacterium]|nr:helix-turn-helix domain-containing protein [Acidobacteriota bacterium]